MKVKELIKALRLYYDSEDNLESCSFISEKDNKIIEIEISDTSLKSGVVKTFSDLSKEM